MPNGSFWPLPVSNSSKAPARKERLPGQGRSDPLDRYHRLSLGYEHDVDVWWGIKLILVRRRVDQNRQHRRRDEKSREPLRPQNVLHGFSLCELIDQFIQVANFSHRWFFNIFHPDTANHALDQ